VSKKNPQSQAEHALVASKTGAPITYSSKRDDATRHVGYAKDALLHALHSPQQELEIIAKDKNSPMLHRMAADSVLGASQSVDLPLKQCNIQLMKCLATIGYQRKKGK
jgi:hypothetical protein